MGESAPSNGKRRALLRTGRMEAFSDGVMAIAITLLILEIVIPSGEKNLLHAVLEEWPMYLAYFVSFFTIGAVWMQHSAITEFIDRVDPVFLRINLILLMAVAFLPMPTRLLADYIDSGASAERVAVTIYGLTLFFTRVMVYVLWRYGVRSKLIRPDLEDDDIRAVSQTLAPSLGFYVLAIVIGLLFPIVAVGIYLLIAIALVFPYRSVARRVRARRHKGATS